MARRILLGLLALTTLGVVVVAVVLIQAHLTINELHPPLPDAKQIFQAPVQGELPIKLYVVHTAQQKSPRSGVLDSTLDPNSEQPYVMAYPAFVLEWPDGRLFLIDTGLTPEEAIAFGAPLEWLGADPIAPLGSVGEQLGSARQRVAGAAFTHLHQDHTSGLESLCFGRQAALPVFQTRLQAQVGNFTTADGEEDIQETLCATTQTIADVPLSPIPGFPGLFAIRAAGHTPGSQIFIARVNTEDGPTTWVFTGDVVNHIGGIEHDVPKPELYSLLVVPESEIRLGGLRRYLAELQSKEGIRLLVSHDLHQIQSQQVPVWKASDPSR